ncbi:MAG: hypothetical protein K0U29_07170 [Gammaproteobacteria bacterium]|nr:hypothetical protein [Gammaproteobacteria bacterium]
MSQYKCMKCSKVVGQPPVALPTDDAKEACSVSMDNDPVKNAKPRTKPIPEAPVCCGGFMTLQVRPDK